MFIDILNTIDEVWTKDQEYMQPRSNSYCSVIIYL